MDSEAEFRHILAISLHSLLFFLTAYVLMTLSDLESDYINSRECCDRLNFWTKPRLVGLIFLCLLPASGPTWIPALLAFPFMAWYFRRLWKVPIGNSGLYEPTEIRLRHLLRQSIQENVVYTVFHSLAFFCLMGLLINKLIIGAEEVPF